MNSSKKVRNLLVLVLAALIWGVAFVAQSKGGEAAGPYSFNCIRSIIGGIVLIPVIKVLDRFGVTSKKPITREQKKNLFFGGLFCGIALFVAGTLQQLGIFYGSSAGKAGFLTACYILLVPVLSLFLKKRCGWNIWAAVSIAIIGLYLLCMNGTFGLENSDILLLLCAFVFAIHILIIDRFSPLVDGVRLSCIQFFVSGLLGAIPMYFVEMKHSTEGIRDWGPMMASWEVWIPILYAGVMSCGVAYTLQIIGQNGLNPTVASLVLSLESVFSVVAGGILLHEKMSEKELVGCGLILGAILLAQIPVKGVKERR
ncbi:MAG TPA: EamA family transporter [Lachnospiraceae bacterium]|nr:DMT family transporter [uncultured Lachnoclostridium sp.]HAU88237.1 EamA family transporter [Lachnospiraceae bacterium]